MTTVVNNPSPITDSGNGNGMGMVIGMLFIVGIAFIFFVYGMPALRSAGSSAPAVVVPQVVIPDKIDVNIQQPK